MSCAYHRFYSKHICIHNSYPWHPLIIEEIYWAMCCFCFVCPMASPMRLNDRSILYSNFLSPPTASNCLAFSLIEKSPPPSWSFDWLMELSACLPDGWQTNKWWNSMQQIGTMWLNSIQLQFLQSLPIKSWEIKYHHITSRKYAHNLKFSFHSWFFSTKQPKVSSF